MRAKYTQRKDGEGFEVKSGKVTRWMCCDCKLVHDLVFISGKGKIGVAAKRNARATANARRAHADAYKGNKP